MPADSPSELFSAPSTTAPSIQAAESAGSDLVADTARVAATRRLQNAHGLAAGGSGMLGGSNRSGPLDELAGVAARLLGADSGRIWLLSDVQQLVGASGPQPAPGPDGVEPLTRWLCAQTAAAQRTVAVPDTGADEDVAALAAVTSGVIGAYLGTPLRSPSGQVVGAIGVFGPDPRTWSEQDSELLSHVATAAAAQLELTALSGERTADRTLLELTIAAAELGTFDLDLATGELVLNERLLTLSELTPQTFGGSPQDVYAHIHPEDREATIAAVAESTTRGGTYAAQYRIVASDGTHRWVAARGTTLPGPDGSPARLLGAAYDISAVRQAATRAEQMMDAMAVAYLAMDATDPHHWPITYVNDEGERIAAASREHLVGRSFWDAFPATVGTVFEQRYRDAVATGRTVSFDAFYPAPLDVWVEVRAVPETTRSGQASSRGLGLYFLDITARKNAQADAEAAAARAELLGSRYTDGLVERRSDDSLAVGLDRLQDVLEELAQAGGPDGLDLDGLIDQVLTRMLPARVEDDVAVIAIRLHRQDQPRPAEAGPRRVPPHVPAEPEPDA